MASKSTAVKQVEISETHTAKPSVRQVPPAASLPAARTARAHDDGGFDRLIYERVRLGIMSALATNDELTFNELKALFDVSDGNLGAHARKLEEAGYIACTKSFEARRPKSRYRITHIGRKALLRYLEHIEAVIKATRRA
jgi:DNA-binding MarR family transcriptional regulator